MMQEWVGPRSGASSWLAILYSAFSQKGSGLHSCRGRLMSNEGMNHGSSSLLWSHFFLPEVTFCPTAISALAVVSMSLSPQRVVRHLLVSLLLCPYSHLLTRCVHLGGGGVALDSKVVSAGLVGGKPPWKLEDSSSSEGDEALDFPRPWSFPKSPLWLDFQ